MFSHTSNTKHRTSNTAIHSERELMRENEKKNRTICLHKIPMEPRMAKKESKENRLINFYNIKRKIRNHSKMFIAMPKMVIALQLKSINIRSRDKTM